MKTKISHPLSPILGNRIRGEWKGLEPEVTNKYLTINRNANIRRKWYLRENANDYSYLDETLRRLRLNYYKTI